MQNRDPNMTGFKIGDRVAWICRPHGKVRQQGFKVEGIIRKFAMVRFGNSKRKRGASIEVKSKKYLSLYNNKRRNTFISIENLTKINPK